MEHIILNLEAPLMAFGGETIDNYGVIRRFPAASMLTGMLANALGWRRIEGDRHQRLQDRIVFAARIDRETAGGVHIQDYQSAAITNRDKSWTTRGITEGRAGGTFTNWLRYRDYFADMRVTVALRLTQPDETPTLDNLAQALDEPARPLFIGRKPCLPSAPIYAGQCDADSALEALISTPVEAQDADSADIHLLWQDGESSGQPSDQQVRLINSYMLTDQRNWRSGLHGGGRLVHEGTLPVERFGKLSNGQSNGQKEERK